MDISYESIEFECPNCGFVNETLVKQVVAEETVVCPGCYAEIHLVDDGGSVRRAQSDIDGALRDLEHTLASFGR